MSKGKRYGGKPKLNIKKVFGLIMAILVIIMVIISINKLLNKTDKSEDKNINVKYFAAYTNNKWGVIDTNGKAVISPEYEEMIIIPDNDKPLFITINNINGIDNTYSTKVLNEKNEPIFTQYELVESIDNYDLQNNMWYEKGILKVKKDGLYGLIDYEGKLLLPCEYEKIYSLKKITNSLIIEKDGKKGLVSNLGEIIIPVEYKDIKPLGDKFEDGYIVVNNDNFYGIIAATKKVILEPKYKEIKEVFGNDMYFVKDDKWKIINKNKEIVLETGFDDVKSINGENIIIIKDKKYGVINTKGEEIIPFKYEELKFAFTGYYIVKQNGKYGILNISNEMSVTPEYSSIIYRKDADFFEAEKEGNDIFVIDRNLEVKLTGIISEVNIEYGYIKARVNNENKYYNFKFEEKKNTEVLPSRTLYLEKKNGKYGFIDKGGNVVVDYIYEDATEQNQYGYAGVKKDGKWGSINKIGKVVLETTLDLENNLLIDFIDKWHLGQDINMNYYTGR